MSITVGAALKQIAITLLSNKKVMHAVLSIALGLILFIIMPFTAIIAIFNGDIDIDYDRLQEIVVENMTEEERERLQLIDDTAHEIVDRMTEAGYGSRQILAAQVLFVAALSSYAGESDFVDRLVGCFAEDQTDAQLIANINAEFGTDIDPDEFTQIMLSVHREIVAVALSQVGNVGGEPYWSWYGFESRVEWCACFVSWCANECGYLDAGIIPKFSSCVEGVNWFKGKEQWLDGTETPEPGMIIFFDWDRDGQDGVSDHVGIVERVENGRVYTVEGNSGDACRQNSYSIGHYEIMGYGTYSPN